MSIVVEAVEHVELGERQRVEPVDAHAVADGDRVVPAAAPRPAGDRAVLVAAVAQPVAHLAGQLGRQRPLADARRVGLDDAQDAADRPRADAEPGADAADRRVRRGDVGIGAVIDVEQRALRAFEQDRLARRASRRLSISDTSRTIGCSRSPCSSSCSSTGSQSIVESCTRRLRAATLSRTLCSSAARIGQIADADAAARNLVLVGRTDAARGRADLALAAPRLRQQVEIAVIRQDQVRLVADEQPVADVDAVLRRARRPRRTAPADRRRRRCR